VAVAEALKSMDIDIIRVEAGAGPCWSLSTQAPSMDEVGMLELVELEASGCDPSCDMDRVA
jgi:hypothetical protein